MRPGAGAGAEMIFLINIYSSQFGGCKDEETYFIWYYCYSTLLRCNIWQDLELAPELWPKVEQKPKIHNFGSATLI